MEPSAAMPPAQATALAELASLYAEAGLELADEERRIVERLIVKADQ